MLRHPLRPFARALFRGEHLDVTRLNEARDEIEEAGAINVDAVASLAVGAGEGVKERAHTAIKGDKKKNSNRIHHHPRTVGEKIGRGRRRTTSYLAITGVLKAPDLAALEKKIDLVVAHAKANKDRIESGDETRGFPNLEHFTKIASGLLGLNKGLDRVSEVRVVDYHPKSKKKEVDIHAFDTRGYHVLWAEFEKLAPGMLYVASLRATHGRNTEDLGLDFGGSGVPGRGNGALTAEGLEALITVGARRGLHAIATRPGSPMVARLYEKMGFTEPGADSPFRKKPVEWALENVPLASELLDVMTLAKKEVRALRRSWRGEDPDFLMILDLTNPKAVRQALSAFAHSRAAIDDVPKDVAAKLKRSGGEHSPPCRDEWAKELDEEFSNVRVVRR